METLFWMGLVGFYLLAALGVGAWWLIRKFQLHRRFPPK